jgi:nucleoside 2-deoxyribosyltransferase
MTEHTIYQAGPLFADAGKNWHKSAKMQLESAGFVRTVPELITLLGKN